MKTYFDLHFPIQRTQIKYSNRNEWINCILKKDRIEKERLFIYNIRSNIQTKRTKINIKEVYKTIFRTREGLRLLPR